MHYLDLVLILVIGFFIVKGLFKGFVNEALGLAGYVIAIIVVANTRGPLSNLISHVFGISKVAALLAAMICSFIVIMLTISITSRLITKAAKKLHLSLMNRIAGGAFGALEAIIVSGLCLVALIKNPVFPKLGASIAKNSILTPYIMNFLAFILDALSL